MTHCSLSASTSNGRTVGSTAVVYIALTLYESRESPAECVCASVCICVCVCVCVCVKYGINGMRFLVSGLTNQKALSVGLALSGSLCCGRVIINVILWSCFKQHVFFKFCLINQILPSLHPLSLSLALPLCVCVCVCSIQMNILS